MSIKVFDVISGVWSVLFFCLLLFCVVNAVMSVKREKKRFVLSYILESVMILINLLFMYMVDGGYVLYGNHKFSGLSAMGDWLWFVVLLFAVLVPVLVTLVCHIVYVWKKRKS